MALNCSPDLNLQATRGTLSRAPPFNRLGRWRHVGHPPSRIGRLKPAQNLVCGVLQPCVRLVELARCLASQLTELVAIFHLRKCLKNKIGPHWYLLVLQLLAPDELMDNHPGAAEGSRYKRGPPKLMLPPLRRACQARERKILAAIARFEMDAMPYRFRDCASKIRVPRTAFPGA